jgi:DNA-binding NtrC family response regulator
MSAKRVLVVPPRWPLAERLRADGYDVVEASTPDDAVERAGAGVDVILLDVQMPEESALAVLQGLRERDPDPPVILLARRVDAEIVTTALAAGAFDYVYEPIEPDDIARRVVRAFEITRLRRELRTLRDRLARPFTASSILGPSEAMGRVRSLTRKVATNDDLPVLLTGERGTGKDHVARVIHYNGGRAMRPFLKVQCAALSETALEAELCGREPHPGSDVAEHSRGLFDEAHEGTILFDDVGSLTPSLQGCLLRYLTTHSFRRVGGNSDVRADVRVIAATTRSLEPAVESGAFRQDLYYRLNVLGFELPPLRTHTEDIGVLARHFFEQHRRDGRRLQRLSPSAEARMVAHTWPGNVDELRTVIDRAAHVTTGDTIDVGDLAAFPAPAASRASGTGSANTFQLPLAGCDLDAVEKSLVLQALERTGGNQTRAAALLGVHRDQIRYRLGKYKKTQIKV